MRAADRANRNLSNAAPVPYFKQSRFWLICLFFVVWACVIAGRMFVLQVVRHQEFVERAQKQQQRTFEVAPRRGVLYDRNLHELAMTVQVDSIYAVPTQIDDKQTAAHALAAVMHTDPEDAQTTEEQIAGRLNNGHSFAWVARRVTPEVAARVRALTESGAGNIKGIYFTKEFQRFYPDNEIAAQVLGYVGMDDNGLGGLEQKYEAQLHGVPGRMYTAMDARRRVLGSSEHEPEPGGEPELRCTGDGVERRCNADQSQECIAPVEALVRLLAKDLDGSTDELVGERERQEDRRKQGQEKQAPLESRGHPGEGI